VIQTSIVLMGLFAFKENITNQFHIVMEELKMALELTTVRILVVMIVKQLLKVQVPLENHPDSRPMEFL